MNRLIFDQLPVEIRMMVFDHLVTDKKILGTICLTSYNWMTITQNSYSWTLWVKSLLGRKNSKKWSKKFSRFSHESWSTTYFKNPVFNVQFAPEDQVPNRVKNLLFKKFVFIFENKDAQNKQIKSSEWFQILCCAGNLPSLRLLHNCFPITVEAANYKKKYAFRKACAIGYLAVVKWVYSIFYTTYKNDTQTCTNEQFLLDIHYDYFNENCFHTCNNCEFREAVFDACSHNHLEVAKWLYPRANPTAHHPVDGIVLTSTFVEVCEKDYLSVAQWMHTAFKLTIDNIATDKDCAFTSTCIDGNLRFAQWLHTTFNITLKTIRAKDNIALGNACVKGNFFMIRWLCYAFDFITDDLCDYRNSAFNAMFINGNLEIIRWLHSKYSFTDNHVKSNGYYVIYLACKHDDPAVFEWIFSTFNITTTDVKNAEKSIFTPNDEYLYFASCYLSTLKFSPNNWREAYKIFRQTGEFSYLSLYQQLNENLDGYIDDNPIKLDSWS